MNILYIGLESSNWVINICNSLANRGHNITCVVQSLDSYDKTLICNDNIDVIHLDDDMIKTGRIEKYIVSKIIGEEREIDVIFGSHAQGIPIVSSVASYLNIPWVFMILDIPTDLMSADKSRMYSWLHNFLLLKEASEIIVNTVVARNQYFKYTNILLPDENVITYATNLPKEFKLSGCDTDEGYILSICRLTPLKNCILIPEAINYLKKKPKYIAIGRDGGELSLIKDSCEKYDIDFVHYENIGEDKKFDLIRNCSVLVYPQVTHFIGGLSPFEAMFVGKPSIVTNVPVLEELYDNNVLAYFENNNPVDLASKLAFALNLNHDEIVDWKKNISDYAEEKASIEVMSEKIMKILERVVNG